MSNSEYARDNFAVTFGAARQPVLDIAEQVKRLARPPSNLLKIIPHVDGSPQVRELARYYMDIEMKGASTGPASLQLGAARACAGGRVASARGGRGAPTLAQISRSASARPFTTISAK